MPSNKIRTNDHHSFFTGKDIETAVQLIFLFIFYIYYYEFINIQLKNT